MKKHRKKRRGRRKPRLNLGHGLLCALGLLLVVYLVPLAQSAPPFGEGDAVRGRSELSVEQLAKIFSAYGSPLHATAVFDLAEQTGLDDIAFAAFALKETRLATRGVGIGFLNPTGTECDLSLCDRCAPGNGRSWCDFASIDQGTAAWFTLISRSYVTGKIDGGTPWIRPT